MLQFSEEGWYANDDLFGLLHLQVGWQQGIDVIQPLNVAVLLLDLLNGRRVVEGGRITTLLTGQGNLRRRVEIIFNIQ